MDSQSEFSPRGCLFVFLLLLLLKSLDSEGSVIVFGIPAIWFAGFLFYRLVRHVASHFGQEELAPALTVGAIVGTPLVIVLVYIVCEACLSAAEALYDGFGKLVAWHGGIVIRIKGEGTRSKTFIR